MKIKEILIDRLKNPQIIDLTDDEFDKIVNTIYPSEVELRN